MTLTDKQNKGLKIAIQRFLDKEKYTVIAGFAGTGKSELVKFIISALIDYGIDPEEDVVYTSFTGKATQVLAKKGNKNTSTLHRLLYDHFPNPKGGFYRVPKKFISYKIVVVDEISMVPTSLIELLFAHKTHIICLGDPFQLPPIVEADNNHLLDHPHIFLDEIMRQEKESEIVRLSMDLREKKPLNIYNGSELKILHRNELNTGMLTWADQIIVATNITRRTINNQVRELLGYEGILQDGEKIICLRNYWEDITEQGDSLVNGSIGTIHNCFESKIYMPEQIKYFQGAPEYFETIQGQFITDTNDKYKIELDKHMLLTGEPCADWKLSYKLGKISSKTGIEYLPKQFAYGYAITCWKAQGSEWDNVLGIEEGHPFKEEEHYRYLYTLCTRAINKLVLIKKE